MAAPATADWDHRSLEQARVYCTMAQLAAAMNEKASGHYNRWHNWSVVAVSILTVITGSQSIPQITDAGSAPKTTANQVLAVIVAVCSICLGALAGIVSRMDWRGRAVVYAKRSVGYARLAGDIRLELTLPNHNRRDARTFFETVMTKVAELEDMGDPLPSQFKKATQIEDAVLSMWGDTHSVRSLPVHEPTPRVTDPHVASEGDVHVLDGSELMASRKRQLMDLLQCP
jgi:hypothetical protein